jgi:hypothetical protein
LVSCANGKNSEQCLSRRILPFCAGKGKFIGRCARFGDKWFELRAPIATMCFIEFIVRDMKDNPSPLADIGFFLAPGQDGCEITAQAIEYALSKISVTDKWCVEFGAGWDMHGATTSRLIMNRGYHAVLIEGEKPSFQKLEKIYQGNPNVTLKNCYVGFDDATGLDKILSAMPIPRDFDFLSIDIDGNDFHAWVAIQHYQPKVLMIEFNPTIPPEVSFVQPCDPRVNHGSSLSAIVQLGRQKGYELIGVIGVNALFVAKTFFPLFGITDNSLATLWTRRDCVTYLFSGFDGKMFLAGAQKLPWHFAIPIKETKMQAPPKFLRKYRFSRLDKRIHGLLTEPLALLKRTLAKISGRQD